MALARILAVGAVFDLAFAGAIWLAPRASAALLGLELPPDPVYLRLCGILLAILGGIYAAAARAPERYPAVAPVSAAGRLAGCLLLAAAWVSGHPTAFLVLGLADLAIGLATFVAWRRAVALSG